MIEKSEEIIFVDKPKGITSFDVIRILRKKLSKKKMGHAGTLDPLASGLMIIGVDGGTKRMTEFLKLPKVYVAEILLGKRTESGDLAGAVVEEADARNISDESIRLVVENFLGTHELSVPMHSAIKVSGKPLYLLARKKEQGRELTEEEKQIIPPVKKMEVWKIQLLNIARTEKEIVVTIEIGVSSGSYIRTLGEEFGRRLGVPAVLANLRRTQIGEYTLENALVLTQDSPVTQGSPV